VHREGRKPNIVKQHSIREKTCQVVDLPLLEFPEQYALEDQEK
jgi:hypothetical protein